ncbi:MAG TPA: hypothetical protein VG318_13925 [Actinomycetota bacterium]|nr:hypothetical protein [Actinomycetota bacterium]
MTRRTQPALFGLAALCFLLPFADVSCGPFSQSEESFADELQIELPDEGDRLPFKGYELVVGKRLPDEARNAAELVELDGSAHHFASEPFAVVALAAALAGLGLSLLLPPARRAVGGLVAALSGIGALALLGLSPIVRVLGIFRVTWRVGYWACLALFAAAAAVSFLGLRRGTRPQAPELDRGGLGVEVRPPRQ